MPTPTTTLTPLAAPPAAALAILSVCPILIAMPPSSDVSCDGRGEPRGENSLPSLSETDASRASCMCPLRGELSYSPIVLVAGSMGVVGEQSTASSNLRCGDESEAAVEWTVDHQSGARCASKAVSTKHRVDSGSRATSCYAALHAHMRCDHGHARERIARAWQNGQSASRCQRAHQRVAVQNSPPADSLQRPSPSYATRRPARAPMQRTPPHHARDNVLRARAPDMQDVRLMRKELSARRARNRQRTPAPQSAQQS